MPEPRTEIRIEDPRSFGVTVNYSTEDFFGFFGKAIQRVADSVVNPLAWLGGIGLAIEEVGKIKVEHTLEGKGYFWIHNAMAKATAAILRENHENIQHPVSGEWRKNCSQQFDTLFKDIPLVIDYDFLQNPKKTEFIQAFLKSFHGWIGSGLQVEPDQTAKMVAELESRFFQELIREIHNGSYQAIFTHLLHPMAEQEQQEAVRSNYQAHLKAMYHQKLMNEPEMRLSDIYLEPNFYLHIDCLKAKDPRRENRIKHEDSEKNTFLVEPGYEGSLHDYLDHFLSEQDLLDLNVTASPRFLLLLGHPGQGKSSFCRRFLNDYHNQKYRHDKPVFFLRLRDIRDVKGLLKDPEECLRNRIAENEATRQKLELKWKPGEFMDAIWVLDGFDELTMQEQIEKEDIDRFVRTLAEISRTTNGPLIIMTSRLGYVQEKNLKWKDTLVMEISRMSLAQQKDWLNRYRSFHLEKEFSLTEEQLTEIDSREKPAWKGIVPLLQQPILLHMVATAGIDLQDLTTRAGVYKSLFDSLIRKVHTREWAGEEGNIAGLGSVSEKKLRRFLRSIATAIFHSPNESITKEELQSHPQTKHFLTATDSGKLKDSLKYVLVAFYFQEIEEEGQSGPAAFEFLHKSFQEYLTAEEIWFRFLELTDQDEDREYKMEDPIAALHKIFPQLSPRPVSEEIRDYLLEIVSNAPSEDKAKIHEQLLRFAPAMFDNQFLLKFDGEREKWPLQIIANLGYVYIMLLFETYASADRNQKRTELPIPQQILSVIIENHPRRIYLRGGGGADFLVPLKTFGRNLRGADLRGADLSHADLSGADLRRADLIEADLRRADLSGADLRRAVLIEADLRGADLIEADLRRADLIEADLRGADLIEADLRGADLSGADLREADLRGADLSEAVLRGADLSEAVLRGADLSEAVLREADLREAVLRGADLREAVLREAVLRGADLREADLSEADLSEADLSEADLSEADLSYAIGLSPIKLQQVVSIAGARGISKEILQKLKSLNPHLSV